MKTVIFCTVQWQQETERYSMDKELYPEFEEHVQRNLGKIIQEEEVPFDECTQEFQSQATKPETDLTDTEKLISRA